MSADDPPQALARPLTGAPGDDDRLLERARDARLVLIGGASHGKGADRDRTAEAALRDFRRFPAWMWRNEVVREFVGGCAATSRGAPAAPHRPG